VMHLEAVERPDTDVSFTIQFPKARERTPDNRQQFAETRIALVDDEWTWEITDGTVRKSPLSPQQKKFFDVLLVLHRNTQRAYGKTSVPINDWREECFKRGLLDRSNAAASKTKFSNNKGALVERNWIAANEIEVWVNP